MVFGVPVFLEPPNWQQQDEQTGSGGPENPPPKTTSFSASIRPPLMLERSRVATAQPPEPALKCPRCESTNTKFCYYNNYSKSQPRHFCKTCRRYWTRGGALRNVPVGGGCRRNKRSKNNNTRSPPISDRAAASDGAIAIPTTAGIEVLGLDQNQIPQPPPQLPFMSNFHQFTDFPTDVGFAGTHSLRSDRLGGSSSGGGGGVGEIDYSGGQNSGSVGQWRLPHQNQHLQIGFSQADGMIGLESAPAPPQGLFPFDMEQQYYAGSQLRTKPPASNLSLIKSEENQNLPRQFLGLQHGSDQYAWTDLYLSGFTSSTSPLL